MKVLEELTFEGKKAKIAEKRVVEKKKGDMQEKTEVIRGRREEEDQDIGKVLRKTLSFTVKQNYTFKLCALMVLAHEI